MQRLPHIMAKGILKQLTGEADLSDAATDRN
jgi:hypothetical protein